MIRPTSRGALGYWLTAVVVVTAAPTGNAQDKYKSYKEAASAGAKFVNSGNLAAAREPLEAAFKLANTDREKLDAQRALLVPYRELQEIGPMQGAAEYIIANSEQAAERSLTRGTVLAFVQKRGKMDEAVKGYEERLKKAPEDRTLLYLLTEAHATYTKNATRSVELGEKLAAVEKKLGKKVDVPGQAQLAQQYIKAGKLKEGAELYEEIAPLDPKLEAWHYKEAATTWLKAKDKTKALAAAKKSEKAATPEKRSEQLTHFWHRALGDVFLEGGEPKEAIPHYEQAIASTKTAGYIKDCQMKLAQAEAAAKK